MVDWRTHWETIYRRQGPTAVSWHRSHLETSLRLIERAGLGAEARIIDVGGGASTLVDDLLDRGFRHVTVLDIAAAAIEAARARLGTRAEDRRQYLETLRHAVRPGGCVILATFALDGPPRCSGLDVVRYSPQTLQAELGRSFTLIDSLSEDHQTPAGRHQAFAYNLFQVTN